MRRVKTDAVRTCAVCALLVLGTVALFSRSMTFGFVNFDDPAFVLNNPYVQRGLTWDGVRWAFGVGRDLWHPLTWVSLMLDREIAPTGAAVFHIVNILWHAANTALVFLLVRRITGAFWMAAVCAALFAWHPQRVESVTWITERKDVLSGFFVLLSVWLYLAYGDARQKGGTPARVITAYGAALVAFICGALSKSVVVTLPLVLLMLDHWPLRRWEAVSPSGPAWRAWAYLVGEKVPFFIVSLLVGLFTVSTQEASGAFSLSLSLDQRMANAVVSVARYLGMFFWPIGLSPLYPHPGYWPLLQVGAAGLLLAMLTAVALACWRERPWVAVGWGWFLAFLAPALGILQVGVQAMADRYTYLPMIGFQLALLETVRRVQERWGARARAVTAAATVVVLAAFGLRTWDQQAVWRDTESLFTHALAVTRDNFLAHGALAMEYLAQSRLTDAARHAEMAAAIAPDVPLVLDVLASVRLAQGRVDEAVENYQRVIARQPASISARNDLGRIFLAQGRLDQAAGLFAEARDRRPSNIQARLGLADVALARGQYEDALAELTRALEIAPYEGRIALRVAAVQARVGRKEQAASTLAALAERQPEDAGLQREVGDMLGQLGHFDAAAAAYERALAASPGDAALHARLGYVHYLRKQHAEAIRSWERALALDPKMSELEQRIRQARAALGGGK